MTKILVIAPYPGFRDLFLEVNEELNKEIHVEVGDLYQGLTIAKSLEDNGYDVIISRGATARLLQEHCTIPVVEAKISGYDIMRTLTLVKGFPGKIGLMSFMNIIQGADAIGSLLNMDLTFFPIQEEHEMEKRIKEAITQEIEVIIGDVISTATASQYGINTILITSGKEAILESIRDAEHLVFYTKRKSRRNLLVERIVDSSPEGIIAIDSTGSVIVCNQKAEVMLGIDRIRVNGKKAEETVPSLGIDKVLKEGHPVREVMSFSGEEIIINKLPFQIENTWGAVAFIQSVNELRSIENQTRYKLDKNRFKAKIHFNHLVQTSSAMKKVVKTAKQYSKNDFPILLYGEPGTGKTSIAQAIHNASERRQFPFVFINCEAFEEEQFAIELFGNDEREVSPGLFELAEGGTLLIDAIGRMPLSIQAKMINVLQEKQVIRVNGKKTIPVNVRIIAANADDLKQNVASGDFREDLYHLLGTDTITIPPLRERIEDLDELIRWFIAALNVTLGKQIVGIRSEVMKHLKEADWPGNVQELKNVVRKMCVAGTDLFIKEEDVKSILDDLMKKSSTSGGTGIVISGKTLDQIEKEVINRVLVEEKYNQSKVAKRLGINRTTLWRKMKE